MSLIASLKNQTDAARPEVIYIDQCDFGKIAKKVQKDLRGVTSSYIDAGIEHLKRYYALAVLEPDEVHAVSMPVDPFWHAHILFSADYFEFCDRAFGNYLHHVPLDNDDRSAVEHVRTIYDNTLEMHEKHFKYVDEAWLPKSDAPNSLICFDDRN